MPSSSVRAGQPGAAEVAASGDLGSDSKVTFETDLTDGGGSDEVIGVHEAIAALQVDQRPAKVGELE